MPAALLHSQFDALEPLGADERGVVIDLSGDVQDPQVIVATFLAEYVARQHP
jgi:gluconokinase